MESNEEWRSIAGSTAYEVSNLGRVRVFSSWKYVYRGEPVVITPKILKPSISDRGYLRVFVRINGVMKSKTIHRLVAETFILNPEGKPQVNHKNHVRTDNRVENLEWMTAAENTAHAFSIYQPNMRRGENHAASKLTASDVLFIRDMLESRNTTRREIAHRFGVSERNICKIANGKSWASLRAGMD